MPSEERKKLPALSTSPEGYRLLKDFAHAHDVSVSEAIRQLLQESPRLVDFAGSKGVDLDVLNVGQWGGHKGRSSKSDDEGEG